MATVIRGVVGAALSFSAQPSFGWFDFVIPMGYTPGDGISVAINAELFGDTGNIDFNDMAVGVVTFDGGPLTHAALSADNLALLATKELVSYYAGIQSPTITPSTLTFAIPGDNTGDGNIPGSGGTTLEPVSNMRGAPFNIVGGADDQGWFIVTTSSAGAMGFDPIRGDPPAQSQVFIGSDVTPGDAPWDIGIPEGTRQFGPGDTVSVMIIGGILPGGSPGGLAVQQQINSISVTVGMTTTAIDLTTFRKGFGPGSGSYYADQVINSGAAAFHSFALRTYTPPAPSFQPYRIQVGLIPARVGSGGAGLG